MKRWLKTIGLVLLGLVVVVAVIMFTPLVDPDLTSRPQPTKSYAEAQDRIDEVLAQDAAADIIPEAKSIAHLTGSREETVVVIFHGYTSVPAQFRLIAEGYRDQGCNVWVPRLPYHGDSDKMTKAFSKVDANVLRRFADDNIDIAEGLGRNVVVIGLSGGGSLAVWSGYERASVDQVILLSPVLHPLGFPEWADRPLARGLKVLPVDVYKWWDAETKADKIEGYNYPRLSLKGLAGFLMLSHWVDDRAEKAGPSEKPWLLVRNDGDQRLDTGFNERYMNRVVSADSLEVYQIPKSAGLLHNFVSAETFSESWDNIDVAYDYLEQALLIPLPDPTP